MHRIAFGSVRVRITAVATLVVAIAITFAGVALVKVIEDRLVGQVRAQGQAQLAATEASLVDGGIAPELPAIVGLMGFVQVFDSQGALVAGAPDRFGVASVAASNGVDGSSGTFANFLQSGVIVDGGTQVDVPIPGFAAAIPFELQSSTVHNAQGQAFTVLVASPLDGVQQSIDALKATLVKVLPFVVALVGLVAWLVVGRSLRPVEAMRREVESITATTMHRRVPEPRTTDEIGRLAHTMNAMLDRLETSAARQRQFVSDASHELRSPITAIRAELEVALHAGDRADWPQVAQGLLDEENRLEALVADLLLMASVDEQNTGDDDAPVDMLALVKAEALRSRRVAVTVVSDIDAVYVTGRADQLGRVIGNLLDNAVRFAHRSVELALCSDGPIVRVTVDDDGPGIALHDRQRVFERFTRLDRSRARDAGGAGLGLALAKGIVERHHGTIHIGDSALGGAQLIVELPAVTVHAATNLARTATQVRPTADRIADTGSRPS
jgi:signal transduction histidine kinase